MTAASARKAARYAGAWTLETWELFRNGELDAYPHGPDGEGRLVLSSNGLMSAFFQRAGWAGVDAGVRPSWDRFIAFGGAWRLEDEALVFDLAFASEPRWIGRTLTRPLAQDAASRLDKKRLVYETPEVTNRRGERLINRLSWRKHE